ncbi:MAG: hypothetical protein V4527_18380 [Pseudomonadota bacterium]
MSQLLTLPVARSTDSNNDLYSGALLDAFLTGGTTRTPVYTTSARNVEHTNPVEANSAGLWPAIYIDPAVTYRFRARTAAGANISGMDFDPVNAANASDLTYTPSGTGGTASTVGDELNRTVWAENYGYATGKTGTQNAAAMALAIAKLSSGGIVRIGPGGFMQDTVTLPAGITIAGAGMGVTILTQGTTASSYGMFYAESSGASAYIDDITIRDLTVQNTAGTFSQFIHLMAFAGVRDLLIERVEFKGFRGDGLCLHSRAVSDLTERHNINVTVRDCIFNGVNNENRNGISVVDGKTVLVDNCTFKNCTKSTMPGAVDIEPDQTYSIIDDITVSNSRFEATGGNLAAIGCLVASSIVHVPVGLNVAFNSFTGTTASPDFFLDVSRTLTVASADMAVSLVGNQGQSGYLPFDLRACKGVRIDATNIWQDYSRPTQIGFTGSTDLAIDVTSEASLIRCGTDAVSENAGMFICKASNVRLGGELYKCGPAAADGYPILFADTVTSDNIHLMPSLRITLNTSQVNSIEATGHTQTPATNRLSPEANLGGGVSEFTANNPVGLAVLVTGTVTVAAPGTTATSRVFVQRSIDGGTPGCSYSITRVAGTSFTITSKRSDGTTTETSDTSTISYQLLPA